MLDAGMPRVTVALGDEGASDTGVLDAVTPHVTASLTGTAGNPGMLSSAAPRAVVVISGVLVESGVMSVGVPLVTASISDAQKPAPPPVRVLNGRGRIGFLAGRGRSDRLAAAVPIRTLEGSIP